MDAPQAKKMGILMNAVDKKQVFLSAPQAKKKGYFGNLENFRVEPPRGWGGGVRILAA